MLSRGVCDRDQLIALGTDRNFGRSFVQHRSRKYRKTSTHTVMTNAENSVGLQDRSGYQAVPQILADPLPDSTQALGDPAVLDNALWALASGHPPGITFLFRRPASVA